MADEKSTNPPRIHPRKVSEKFSASKRYARPLELWPYEYHRFEDLSFAVEELAELARRAGEEGKLGHTLKTISNQLFAPVEIMHERYLVQEAERKAAEPKRKAKPKPRPQGGNVKDFNGPQKGDR